MHNSGYYVIGLDETGPVNVRSPEMHYSVSCQPFQNISV